MQRKVVFASAAVALLISLSGCAITNETSVLIGSPRTPIAAEQVKLYTSPPKKFVEIAIISADAAHDFMSKHALLDKAVLNAKQQAAKVGANGILLDALGDLQLGSAGAVLVPRLAAGSPVMAATVGTVNRTGKKVSGKAIYVTEE
jgi:hypothetical protein